MKIYERDKSSSALVRTKDGAQHPRLSLAMPEAVPLSPHHTQGSKNTVRKHWCAGFMTN